MIEKEETLRLNTCYLKKFIGNKEQNTWPHSINGQNRKELIKLILKMGKHSPSFTAIEI